jgi:hypothetical protein
MKKIHIYIVVLLGVFLMPNSAMACGNSNTSKETCSKEMTAKSTKKKSCCGTDSCSKKEKQKSCDGKCGHSMCSTSSVNSSLFLSFEIENQINNFFFASKKQKFYSSVAFLSDGYSSLWLIPKIS